MFKIIREKKVTPIKRQLQDFCEWKTKTKSSHVAAHHREWIVKFIYITKVEDIFDVTVEDYDKFYTWIYTNYASDYHVKDGLHSLRCFMKYYRIYEYLKV